jgi:hypothetical protein
MEAGLDKVRRNESSAKKLVADFEQGISKRKS